MKYKYVAIIPARGGSKRFPKKNIHALCGKPLIAYSIEYAKACEYVEEVYVSTDSKEIAEVSMRYGAKILDRPDELAGDFVPTVDVLKDSVVRLEKQGVEIDAVVLLQPTNPLRPSALIKEAIRKMEEGKNDSLCTVNRSNKKLGKIIDEKFVPWNYTFGQRSQDLEPLYYENGLLYIIRKELLLQGRILGDSMYPLVMEHVFGTVDIDEREDLDYAKFIMQNYHE
jgi:N-acylneuraminate cytidylyltransferase